MGSPPEPERREREFTRIALERGYVSPDRLETALRTKADREREGESVTLGQVLLKLGWLRVEQYLEVLKEQGQTGLGCPGCGDVIDVTGQPAGARLICLACGGEVTVAPLEGLPASGTLPPRDLRPSQKFGRYTVERFLAEGAMGAIYLARDEELGRPVALKLLKGATEAPGRLKRFQREATLAARIRHPNIVTVYELGEIDGTPYIAMEYIEGKALSEAWAPWDLRRRVEVLERVARAVGAAHEAGIIHRDLKPENVMVEAGGRVVVTDFGLARADLEGTRLTRTGAVMGTPGYMAPEQVRGERADARTDVYALGVLLFEALTNHLPYMGDTVAEVFRKIDEEDPPRAHRVRPGVPRDLSAVSEKALSKEREHRYADATEFAQEVARWLRGEGVGARPTSTFRRFLRKARRNPVAVVTAAATGLLALGAFVAWEWSRPGFIVVRTNVAGASVRIGGEEIAVPAEGVRVPVRPGRSPWEATAPGYQVLGGELHVARGETRELRIDLVRRSGRLAVESEPHAYVVIDGTYHGTPVPGLPLPTGRYTIRIEEKGRYGLRQEVEIEEGRTTSLWVYLPEAPVAWSLNIPDQPSIYEVGDVNGGGVPDFLVIDMVVPMLVAGESGAVLWRREGWEMAYPSGVHADDLDGDGAMEIVACWRGSGDEGRLAALRLGPDRPSPIWEVPEFQLLATDPAAGWLSPGDLDGVRGRDFLVACRDGTVLALAGSTGRELWRAAIGADLSGLTAQKVGPSALILTSPGRLTCLDVASGGLRWSRPLDEPSALVWMPLPRLGRILLIEGTDWVQVDVASGAEAARSSSREVGSPRRLLAAGPVVVGFGEETTVGWDPEREVALWRLEGIAPSGSPRGVFADAGGIPCSLILDRPDGTVRVVDVRTGETRWEVAAGGPVHVVPIVVNGESRALVKAGRRLELRIPATGEVLWGLEAESPITAFPVVADQDRDGRDEIFFGTEDGHILALSAGGQEIFSLLTGEPLRAIRLLDGDGDGLQDFLVTTGAGLALLRSNRVIWTRDLGIPVRAGPTLVDADGDGTDDVILPVSPIGEKEVVAFDGRSGRPLWSVRYNHDMIRPVCLADLAGDARPEVVTWDWGETALRILDPRTGSDAARWRVPQAGYAEPAVGDLDGDGRRDLALSGWGPSFTCFAVSGKTGALMWETPVSNPAWKAASIQDVDGDGEPEVFYALRDGTVICLEGRSGERRWEQRTGGSNDGGAVIGTWTVEGTSVVCVNAMYGEGVSGALFFFDARSGDPGGTVRFRGGSRSTPVFADIDGDGRSEILVGTTGDGVVCSEQGGRVRWATGRAVCHSRPLVVDLDRDGRSEMVATLAGLPIGGAAPEGRDRSRELTPWVLCADLRTGQTRWTYVSGGNGAVEGDPCVSDFDGDGVLDVVFSAGDRRLTVLSGRGRMPQRDADF